MSYISTRLDADPRRHLRQNMNVVSELTAPDGQSYRVWTLECSGGGARIIVEDPPENTLHGEGWLLTIPRLGCYDIRMKWRRGTTYGVSFAMPIEEQDHLAARLTHIAPRLQ